MDEKKIIIANWKMHKTLPEGLELTRDIKDYALQYPLNNLQLIIMPPFTYLQAIHELLGETDIQVGAQNCHQLAFGNFTGEISAPMLASVGARYVLVGHSERRQYNQETNAIVAQKLETVLQSGLTPILCCGEPINVREQGQHDTYVAHQLRESIGYLKEEQLAKIILAYEPIWAIGTGKTPSLIDIEAMQDTLRKAIAELHNHTVANNLKILYGGSCNSTNVVSLLHIPGISGVLVGNASLHSQELIKLLTLLQLQRP